MLDTYLVLPTCQLRDILFISLWSVHHYHCLPSVAFCGFKLLQNSGHRGVNSLLAQQPHFRSLLLRERWLRVFAGWQVKGYYPRSLSSLKCALPQIVGYVPYLFFLSKLFQKQLSTHPWWVILDSLESSLNSFLQ